MCIRSDHKPVRACFEIKLVDGKHGSSMPLYCVSITAIGILAPKDEPVMEREPSTSIHISRMLSQSYSRKTFLGKPKFLQVEISDLQGEDLTELDMQISGGLSDPYVLVTADPIQILETAPPIKSDVVYHNINPVWENPIVFQLSTIDLNGLSNTAHLFLSGNATLPPCNSSTK